MNKQSQDKFAAEERVEGDREPGGERVGGFRWGWLRVPQSHPFIAHLTDVGLEGHTQLSPCFLEVIKWDPPSTSKSELLTIMERAPRWASEILGSAPGSENSCGTLSKLLSLLGLSLLPCKIRGLGLEGCK